AEIQRWRGILGCWPASACRYEPPRSASYRYDWGTWWSLEDAPWGAGWNDTAWAAPAWTPRSYAWMHSPQARLWVPLAPVGHPYQLRVRFYAWASQTARDSLAISVNGKPVHLYRQKEDTAIAEVPAADLVSGLNDVTFTVALNPKAGISGAMDWMALTPAVDAIGGLRDWPDSTLAAAGGAGAGGPTGQTAALGHNAVISFDNHGNADPFKGAGWWSQPDAAFTWTEGTDSDLKMTLRQSKTGYRLVFDAFPFTSAPFPVRTVRVSANGRALNTWFFTGSGWSSSIVDIPPELTGVPIVLHLHQSATPSPKELGASADPRHVGLGVKTVTVEARP